MPQQINLCTPILLTQKRYFSAQTMALALSVFLLLGGGLCSYWVMSLNAASEGFRQTLSTQSRELDSLKVALLQGQAGAGSDGAALTRELQGRRAELLQREQLLQDLQRGAFTPGWGHSDRLRLLAQSIPSQVWLTAMKADESGLEVNGFTLEPAQLNAWVNRLSASALLQGQQLAGVKVERASPDPLTDPRRPIWSFNLVSAVNRPIASAGGSP